VIIGIDATNLRHGGGRTHLIELLRAANTSRHYFSRVVVWGSKSTLDLLDDQEWLLKLNPNEQEKGLLGRVIWQLFSLSRCARAEDCDVLFIPGGAYAGSFHPVVSMSQNLLPFEWSELKRYGLSFITLKLLVLRVIQVISFKRSEGLIFLSEYAKQSVQKVSGPLRPEMSVIAHGLNSRFLAPDKTYLASRPTKFGDVIRLIYVSTVDLYKHQWHVVEAIARAREESGLNLQLDLVGAAYAPALDLLMEAFVQFDPKGEWTHYHGEVDYNELHLFYSNAHVGIWASSCETFGMILLEMMASGLPVLSSDRGPMSEILGDTGQYFDPEKPNSLTNALIRLLASEDAIYCFSHAAHDKAKRYTWERCADETFGFLKGVVSEYQKKSHTDANS